MNQLKINSFLLIIFILSGSAFAYGKPENTESYSNLPNPSDSDPSSSGFTTNTLHSVGTIVPVTPIAQISTGGIKNDIKYIDYPSSCKDPFIVTKTISPDSENGYLLGDQLLISVEIKYVNQKTTSMNGIRVFEIIDDDLYVVDNEYKYCYTLCTLEQICDYKRNLDNLGSMNGLGEHSDNIVDCYKCTYNCDICNDTHKLFNWDNITKTDVGNLSLLNLLRYNYDIKWAENETSRIFKTDNNTRIYVNHTTTDDYVEITNNHIKNTSKLQICDGESRTYWLLYNNSSGVVDIYDKSTLLKMNVRNLRWNDRLIYYYYVKPKKHGYFKTDTIIRTNSSFDQSYTDIEYPLDLRINYPDPKFDVDLKLKQSRIYKDDILDLIFDITYLGGASEPCCNNISVKPDKDITNDYYYYVNNESARDMPIENCSSETFCMYGTSQIIYHVEYPEPGVYSLPGIWIDEKHYTFNEKQIIVDRNWAYRYPEMASIIFGFIGLIFAIILDHEKLSSLWKKILFWKK